MTTTHRQQYEQKNDCEDIFYVDINKINKENGKLFDWMRG